jgi:hypothetical protein
MIIIGALPSTGLMDNAPVLTKIVGLIAAVLSALNYTYQRSALKRTFYTASIARSSSGSAKTGGAL